MLYRDVLCYLIEFIEIKDRLSLRRVCIQFRDVVDHSTTWIYTFREEMQRKRLAKSIYQLLLSDVDVHHSIYLEIIRCLDDFFVEDETKDYVRANRHSWDTRVRWRRPFRYPTYEEKLRYTHNRICSWLLLFPKWINEHMYMKLDRDDNFFTFWGIPEEARESHRDFNDVNIVKDPSYKIKSDLPQWVMKELNYT